MDNIGIIGYGNMGQAFAKGLQKTGSFGLFVYEKESSKLEPSDGPTFCASLKELVGSCGILLIAVKPQDLVSLLQELKPQIAGKHVISIAAGKTISFYSQNLGTTRITRFMPNLAASVNSSVTGFSCGEGTSAPDKNDALKIAQSVGIALAVPEKLMSAITGISGSGIAYVFRFIHALSLGGTYSGLSYQDSLKAALGVLEGAVNVLHATGNHPEEMLSKVISPAGTTIAGIKALEDGLFSAAIMEAVKAAADRADQLEQ
jgi:pyrroline-5-carboxylate reductase